MLQMVRTLTQFSIALEEMNESGENTGDDGGGGGGEEVLDREAGDQFRNSNASLNGFCAGSPSGEVRLVLLGWCFLDWKTVFHWFMSSILPLRRLSAEDGVSFISSVSVTSVHNRIKAEWITRLTTTYKYSTHSLFVLRHSPLNLQTNTWRFWVYFCSFCITFVGLKVWKCSGKLWITLVWSHTADILLDSLLIL